MPLLPLLWKEANTDNQTEKKIDIEKVIENETKRLTEAVGKSFLDCENIIQLTGLGRDNVRMLMRSKAFPTIRVGNRQVVSVANFVLWTFSQNYN